MEFWGAEVKHGQSVTINLSSKVLHLSQVCLGKKKKNRANKSVRLQVRIGVKKFVIGILHSKRVPQLLLDLVLDKNVTPSHNWKYGSVFFYGHQVAEPSDYNDCGKQKMKITEAVKNIKAFSESDTSDTSDSEEDDDSSDDDDECSDVDEETPNKKQKQKRKNTSEEDKKKSTPETDDSEEDENVNGGSDKSEDTASEERVSEEEKSKKRKRDSNKSSSKKDSAVKPKAKEVAAPKKTSSPQKKTPAKSSTSGSKVKDQSDDGTKTFSRKKRKDAVEEKPATSKKAAPKEKTCGEKVVKEKEKPKSEKHKISDDDLRAAICEILKEVDFNTATFTDILKQLAKRFCTNMTSRTASIKLVIQEELTKLYDEGDK